MGQRTNRYVVIQEIKQYSEKWMGLVNTEVYHHLSARNKEEARRKVQGRVQFIRHNGN
jgi:hypothetical protein